MKKRLRGWGIEGPFFLLHPGSGSKKKVWPPERWVEIMMRIEERGGPSGVILEGPADEDPVRRLISHLSRPPLVIKGMGLREVASLLSLASFYMGNDSGITQLAAAVGTPLLAIFGPTDPRLWAPRGRKAQWIWGKVACSPCTPEERRACPRPLCMEATGVEEVWDRVLGILEGADH